MIQMDNTKFKEYLKEMLKDHMQVEVYINDTETQVAVYFDGELIDEDKSGGAY